MEFIVVVVLKYGKTIAQNLGDSYILFQVVILLEIDFDKLKIHTLNSSANTKNFRVITKKPTIGGKNNKKYSRESSKRKRTNNEWAIRKQIQYINSTVKPSYANNLLMYCHTTFKRQKFFGLKKRQYLTIYCPQ